MRSRSRRLFLRNGATLGAAGALFPWLHRLGRAQAPSFPTRLVIISAGHGFNASSGAAPEWMADTSGALPSTLPPLLQPLAEFRERLTTVDGVDNLLRAVAPDSNHAVTARTMLTCVPHQRVLDGDGRLIPGEHTLGNDDHASGPSIEYEIAQRLGGTPLTLRVGESGSEHRRTYAAAGLPDDGAADPSVAFDRLFAGFVPPDPGGEPEPEPGPAPRDPAAIRRRNRHLVLAAAADAYRNIAPRLRAADRERLQLHIDVLAERAREAEAMSTPGGMTTPGGGGGMVDPLTCADAPLLAGRDSLPERVAHENGPNDDVIGAVHNNLIATAFACQVSQVASVHYSNYNENTFDFLNGGAPYLRDNWHTVCHDEAGTDEQRMRCSRWYFEMVADLCRKLQAIPEGDGTSLLDHTVVLLTSSFSRVGQSHDSNRVPAIVVSRPGGFFRTGEHVQLRDSDRASTADLYVSLMRAMGIEADSFGYDRGVVDSGEPELAGRPWNRGGIPEIIR